MNKILELNDLLCKRDSFQLGPLNWQLPAGVFCCLVGSNGAGKSTLLQAIMGLVQSNSGSWTIAGETIRPRGAAWKDRIGFAFDGQNLHERLSIADNLDLHRSLRSNWDSKLVDHLMTAFKLDRKQTVSRLSRGQKQAFCTLLALAHRPQLLLLDEITNGMDSLVRRAWNECMFQLMAESEMTVLMATHVMSDVSNLADRLVFVNQGHIVADVDKDSLLESWRQISCRVSNPLQSLPRSRRWESHGDAVRFISQDAATDLALLNERRASHIESQPLNLDEICSFILEDNSHV